MSKFTRPARISRMRHFGGPSVWLEFTPLSKLTSSINLGQGSPGWAPPAFVTEGLQSAVNSPAHSQYARSSGALELVNEISRIYTPRVIPAGLDRTIDAETEVVVTVGASEAIFVACTAYLEPGDEAVLIAPAFDFYSASVLLAGATPVYIPLRARSGVAQVRSSGDLVIDMDELASKITDRTKMIILNSPHNPTGKVFSRSEYESIAALLDEKAPSCIVVSDEVYEHLVFSGAHIPFSSVSPSAFERTLSIYSAGKTFSATGLKVGWAIGPASLISELQLAQQYIVFCVNGISQIALAKAMRIADDSYKGYENYYSWICAEYKRKRDFLVSTLEEAGLQPIVPEGAFYVCTRMPEINGITQSGLPESIQRFVEEGRLQIDSATRDRVDYNACRNLALQKGVTTIPLSAFFGEDLIGEVELAQDYVRFAFCKPDDVLESARERLCSQ